MSNRIISWALSRIHTVNSHGKGALYNTAIQDCSQIPSSNLSYKISSIVYLLYLKQIYLHMQHSFITIYSLDSISHGGCNVLWSLGRQMVDIVTEYNSRQKCTLGWFSPAHFCTLLYLPRFCVLKITRERYNLQDAIIYLGSRQWLSVYYQS